MTTTPPLASFPSPPSPSLSPKSSPSALSLLSATSTMRAEFSLGSQTQTYSLAIPSLGVVPKSKTPQGNLKSVSEHKDPRRSNIVDFGIVQGVQWVVLLQALATRSNGRPTKIWISGIPASALGKSPAASLFATGNRLREFANILKLNFEFKPVST
ncbi:SCARECROW-LIKE protein 7 [Fagus crenata]